MDRNMTTPAKIEPWMMQASNDIEDAYAIAIEKETYVTEPAALDIAAIIAGHAPEQEWEAKEKALRELAERWKQLGCEVTCYAWLACDLHAILNTPAASGGRT